MLVVVYYCYNRKWREKKYKNFNQEKASVSHKNNNLLKNLYFAQYVDKNATHCLKLSSFWHNFYLIFI